jgi:hypothetical protein
MDTLETQIADLLGEQAERYRTLRRILLRQTACLRRDDVTGVGAATAEIRETVAQAAELEARLGPLVERWRSRGAAGDDRIPEMAREMAETVAGLQDLRAQNEGLAREAMNRRRQEMVQLNAGVQAVRGYTPRPQGRARFVDRVK